MSEPHLQAGDKFIVERQHLQMLLDILIKRGFRVVGPTIHDDAIVYEELNSIADLPVGWTDEQDGGSYRLKKRIDKALFSYIIGPQSWKKFLVPPVTRLWKAKHNGSEFQIVENIQELPKHAFLGVRSCDLHAISIQDKIFLNGNYVDPIYKARRENIFIVAVNCGRAGNTCFCVSMNAGPEVTFGFDLAMTEVLDNNLHYFVVEAGTEIGADVLHKMPHKEAGENEISIAESIVAKTSGEMGRIIDITDIKHLLYSSYENPRWDDVAARCLTCGNCTMVCPTCFCTTVEDITDLKGEYAERWRSWDSCFTLDFSYIHSSSIRSSAGSRYRQWLIHKLAAWIDQFGTYGCVGCGRCITWCPVAIDITEEVRAIKET